MASTTDDRPDVSTQRSKSLTLTVAGALLVGGLLGTVLATLFHPSGEEDDHEAIFAKYAADDGWVAVHVVQFVGVLITLGGLLVLCQAFQRFERPSMVARLGAAATVATAATWALLQGLDGVGLKQAVDAWESAPEAERQTYFASAETIRWLEWGFQSYFRLFLGVAFVLIAAVLLTGRLVPRWVAWVALLTGALSLLFGIDVGNNGLASSAQDVVGPAFLVVGLVFGAGVLAAGLRARDRAPR